MRSNIVRGFYYLLFPAILLLGCSTVDTAGGPGTGSETTNGVYARVYYSDGTPASNVSVLLVESEDWFEREMAESTIVIESSVTDNNGFFKFEIPPDGDFNLQIDGDNEGLFIERVRTEYHLYGDTVALDTVYLQQYAVLSGKVRSPSGRPINVSIGGTTYKTDADSVGFFTIESIPAGSFIVYSKVDIISAENLTAIDTVVLNAGQPVVRDSLLAYLRELLLEDFEDMDGQNLLCRFLANSGNFEFGRWHLTNSLGRTDTIVDFSFAIDENEAYKSKSLHLQFVDSVPAQTPFAGITVSFGRGFYDLSNMERFAFSAKGSGSVRVFFHSEIAQLSEGGFIALLDLPQEWELISIYTDDIQPPDGSITQQRGLTWNDAKTAVSDISFFVSENTEIWLDELRIIGVNIDDL